MKTSRNGCIYTGMNTHLLLKAKIIQCILFLQYFFFFNLLFFPTIKKMIIKLLLQLDWFRILKFWKVKISSHLIKIILTLLVIPILGGN